VFGAGGGTNSYREVRDADLIVLWGSNARETHPIFFHHVLRAVRRGARLIVVDPRRTASAQWADSWLGLDVGSDIALANAMAYEILAQGLEHRAFIGRATSGFEDYQTCVAQYAPKRAEAITGVSAQAIRDAARAYARADKALLCWTLGVTEHHNAVDNVFALINLALLTGHVGRYACGLNPLRGQNNVQGGGDMGAIPDHLPGFQDVGDAAARTKFERAWGVNIDSTRGLRLNEMFDAIERGDLTTLYVIGENPAASEANRTRAERLLSTLDHLVVQDVELSRTAEFAHVVLPAAVGWCETEGTVTNSERLVQRVRKTVDAPPHARDDMRIVCDLARSLGHDWGNPSAEQVWDEVRSLSPEHAGMSYRRLDRGGLQWPCWDEEHPGELFLHSRLWEDPISGPRAPFHAVEYEAPVDAITEEFPLRLTTGRRLDSYNTGVQTGAYATPLRRDSIDLSPHDAARLGIREGERVHVTSRRGRVEVEAHIDAGLRAGLVFMSFHSLDAPVNVLTIEANDPKSGTAEFKATAVRVDPASARAPAAGRT